MFANNLTIVNIRDRVCERWRGKNGVGKDGHARSGKWAVRRRKGDVTESNPQGTDRGSKVAVPMSTERGKG